MVGGAGRGKELGGCGISEDDAETRTRALELCRVLHPDLPCTEPCDTCWQAASVGASRERGTE
jgi:hypothetical protein